MALLDTAGIPKEFVCQNVVGLITQSLGAAGGSEKIYVNIDIVPPKAYSTKNHSHSQQEEFFLILSGVGTTEKEDTCYYPDEDMYMQKSNNQWRVFARAAMDTCWNWGPNSVQ